MPAGKIHKKVMKLANKIMRDYRKKGKKISRSTALKLAWGHFRVWGRERSFDPKKAREVMKRRSRRAVALDKKRRAKRVPLDFDTWARRPGRYDWPGVDMPGLPSKPKGTVRLLLRGPPGEWLGDREPRAVRFYRRSGRIMFEATARNAPRDYVFLDRTRIKRAFRIETRDGVYYVIDYETKNTSYYRRFSKLREDEIDKLAQRAREVEKVDAVPVITYAGSDPAEYYWLSIKKHKVDYQDISA